MKLNSLFSFILCLLFSPIFIFGQSKIAKVDFTADFKKAIFNLEKHHLGLYYYGTKEAFDSLKTDILKNVGDSITTTESHNKIAKLVGSIKDLHTSVHVTKPKKPIKNIPLSIKSFSGKYYVNYNTSLDSTFYRGDEVIEIEGVPVGDLIEKLSVYYGPDNDNPYSKYYYSERNFSVFYRYYVGQKDSVVVTFKSFKSDSVFTRSIQTLDAKMSNQILAKRYKNAMKSNLKFTVIDSVNRVGLMDVSSFTMKGNKLDIFQFKFKKMVKKNFKAIKKQGVEHLIVDFRGNGGGNISNISCLTRYVAPEPFRMEDSIYLNKNTFKKSFPIYIPPFYIFGKLYYKKNDQGLYYYTNAKKYFKPRKKLHYSKNLYVLMDGGSYSATTFTIGLWNDMNRATFFGTPPGGANWGSFASKWKMQKLKNTGLTVRIPLYKLVHAQPNKRTSTFTVQPDFFTGISFDDFLQRKDSQKQFVINYIKTKAN